MGRKKVPLQYISNNATRRDTLQKRSEGLMKKASEVDTLCNTKACIVVYGEGESVPQVFPSHDEAVAILNRFRTMKEYEHFNKKMEQESFLQKCIGKLWNQYRKHARDSEDREIRLLVHEAMIEGHVGLSIEELKNVSCKVEVLLKGISDRIAKICGQPPVYQPSQAQVSTPYVVVSAMATIGASVQAQTVSQQQEEWLQLMRTGGGDLWCSRL